MSTFHAVAGRYTEEDKRKALDILKMIGLEEMIYKKQANSPAGRSSGWESPGL